MTNKLQDLIAQRAALDAQIATEKTAQLAVAADAAAQAFADAGVSLDEGAAILLSRHNASKHRRKSAAKGCKRLSIGSICAACKQAREQRRAGKGAA